MKRALKRPEKKNLAPQRCPLKEVKKCAVCVWLGPSMSLKRGVHFGGALVHPPSRPLFRLSPTTESLKQAKRLLTLGIFEIRTVEQFPWQKIFPLLFAKL